MIFNGFSATTCETQYYITGACDARKGIFSHPDGAYENRATSPKEKKNRCEAHLTPYFLHIWFTVCYKLEYM